MSNQTTISDPHLEMLAGSGSAALETGEQSPVGRGQKLAGPGRKQDAVSRSHQNTGEDATTVGTGYTETVTIPCTASQKRRFESLGGAAYVRRVLNGSYAFFESKRREA